MIASSPSGENRVGGEAIDCLCQCLARAAEIELFALAVTVNEPVASPEELVDAWVRETPDRAQAGFNALRDGTSTNRAIDGLLAAQHLSTLNDAGIAELFLNHPLVWTPSLASLLRQMPERAAMLAPVLMGDNSDAGLRGALLIADAIPDNPEVWAYDPRLDSWSARAGMPTPRAAGAAAVVEGKVHLVSGSGTDRLNDVAHEVYDPDTDSWSSAEPILTARDHLSVGVIDGILVAAGGRIDGDPGSNHSVTQLYDPKTDRWSQATDMPTARSGTASAVVDGAMFVMGGESRTAVHDDVEAYVLADDSWTAHPPLRTPRHGFGAATQDGRIYTLVGAPQPGGSRSAVVEVFSPPLRAK